MLHWKVPERLTHPGRQSLPLASEERSQFALTDFPSQVGHVQARSELEESRQRVQAEIAGFAAWVQRSRPSPRRAPVDLLLDYVHDKLTRLQTHPSPRLRVTRPTTPATWLRRLTDAFSDKVPRTSASIRTYLTGLRSLAPAPPPVERGNQGPWIAMLGHVRERFQAASKPPTVRLWGALLLALELQIQGFRPLAAIRGALSQSRRERAAVAGKPAMKVSVVLDKDNKVGAVPAARQRLVVFPPPVLDRLFRFLPYPNDKPSLLLLKGLRTQVRQKFGIRDLRSSRRNAAVEEEQRDRLAGPALNHRPGSKSTANYTGSLTAPSLQAGLAMARLSAGQ